ncbi:MAG: FHA domain-containing protein [Verrucomicrobiae bacterium]|nr:FHA domain-containing protein [Verrucomicrobiae bacterium]
MAAKLIVQPAQGVPFDVRIGNTATIGRTRENTVCLNTSPLVSRQHAVIRSGHGGQYQIIDLGSRNGTFLNDQRVVVPMVLTPGARIRIADTVITFTEDAPEANSEHLQLTVVGTGVHSAIETRPVALLVCDIRDFSTMSEKAAPNEVAQVLGAWFREIGTLVPEGNGTIDKFIGDALLAYWGAARDATLDCAAAFDAGRGMLAKAAARTWPGGEPFRIAVALHYGPVTCRNVGVAADRDATIIGDAVNTVFRLEALSKQLGRPLIFSQEFADHLSPASPVEDHGEHSLKGRQQRVRVFSLAG